MLGYSRSAGYGRIASGENDQVWIPRTPRSGKCGVILLHGSGNPNGYMDPVGQPASQRLAAALCAAGIPCVSGEMGGQTWANNTAMSRIDAAWDLLRTNAPIRSDKVALVGGSMGGALGARYSQLYPAKVAAFVGLIPLLDLVGLYNANTSGVAAEIATAWGVTAPATLPPSADIAANVNLAAGIPAKFWYSGNDTIVLPAWVTNYATALGAEAIDVGTNGHSDATIGQVPVPDVGKFLVANGC